MAQREDQQHGEADVESLVASTVGAQIPSSPASSTPASVLGIRPRLTLIVAGVLAVVAIAAVVALTWHANSARDSEDRLDDIIVNVNGLQDEPWRLESSRVSSGRLGAADVRAQMAATERRILRQLAASQRDAPAEGIAAARQPLLRNFAALSRAVDVIANGRPSRMWLEAPTVFASRDEVLADLDRARSHYSTVADGRLWEATIGSILVMVLLLGGFVVFFWRSLMARKSAERLAAELELSRQHLEQAQSVAGVGSWEWDDRDRILRWSREQSRLHGWPGPAPPPTPRAFLELIASDDRGRVNVAMREAFIEGKPIELEYRVTEARGGRLIRIQASTVVERDGRRRVIGISQDMTERFRRTEAERANRAKNEFISRMSHELRTPLNAVLGFGQLMSMSDLDERQRGNVEHILSAGRHLLDLINEILDISRIESGDMRLSLEPVLLGGVLVEASELVTPVAAENDVSLELDEPPRLWVRADVQRLRQVLLNLLSNAVKYNDSGGHVWVRTRRDALGGRVRIEIEDDGGGIEPAMIERLFRPFERLGAEQTSVEGTGLGLAVSRGMIEAMGGRISVSSVHGEGSTFTVELPEAPEPSPLDERVSPPSREPASPMLMRRGSPRTRTPSRSPTLTVLCIEDNPSNVELIEQILAKRPAVRLLTAHDGGNGLRLAQEERPDLVMLDLDLPDMTGEQVLDELKASRATAAIPVVILSAATAEDHAASLLENGAHSYISKPPGVTALLEAVDGATSAESEPSAV